MSLLYTDNISGEVVDCSVCNNSLCWSDAQYNQYQYYTQVGILTAVIVTLNCVRVANSIISISIIEVGILNAVFVTISYVGVKTSIISIIII